MHIEFNVGLVRGLITLALFVAFISLIIVTYGKRRTPEFELLARMPLDDSDHPLPRQNDEQKR